MVEFFRTTFLWIGHFHAKLLRNSETTQIYVNYRVEYCRDNNFHATMTSLRCYDNSLAKHSA